MQRNDANLADVLFMMARVRELLEDTSEQFSDEVEARWLLEEQPLLLLAGLLDPKHAKDMRVRIRASRTLTIEHMAYFAVIYHKKFIGDNVEGLVDATMEWARGGLAQQQLCGDSQSMWELLRSGSDGGRRALANLALFVLSLPVTTADCERLFSDFSYIQTKQRNRLAAQKMHHLSQLKQEVRRRDTDAVEKKERKRRRIMDPTRLRRAPSSGSAPSGTAATGVAVVEHLTDDEGAGPQPGPVLEATDVIEGEEDVSAGDAMYSVLAEMVDEEDDGEAAEEERQRGLLNPSTQEVAEGHA
eukprot:GHVU01199015.1.p1 GENE.GHVU01199015.1~~GHVU01199015.1.p1  ORF type:complete len:301 (+),score=68.94 GHVU01199015.1:1322-2224(+)